MPKYVVRYGTMRQLGIMNPKGGDNYRRGHQVIARTNRGLEVGEVLCEANDTTSAEIDEENNGQILRQMETDDFTELGRIGVGRQDRFDKCQSHIQSLELDMQLVDIEQIFGGERIIVYYLAEQRVDFRELVKQLASEFQTRIEMRQIGVRDEAKLLADYGDCGKPVCCNTHLSSMPPVSMKMAKIQKATLDPNKISGRCGRLKCCLRYEYDTYLSIQREFPKMGADVVTREGRGRVIGQELLAEQVLLEMEDHRRMLVDLKDVLSVLKRENRPNQTNTESKTNGAQKKTGKDSSNENSVNDSGETTKKSRESTREEDATKQTTRNSKTRERSSGSERQESKSRRQGNRKRDGGRRPKPNENRNDDSDPSANKSASHEAKSNQDEGSERVRPDKNKDHTGTSDQDVPRKHDSDALGPDEKKSDK